MGIAASASCDDFVRSRRTECSQRTSRKSAQSANRSLLRARGREEQPQIWGNCMKRILLSASRWAPCPGGTECRVRGKRVFAVWRVRAVGLGELGHCRARGFQEGTRSRTGSLHACLPTCLTDRTTCAEHLGSSQPWPEPELRLELRPRGAELAPLTSPAEPKETRHWQKTTESRNQYYVIC